MIRNSILIRNRDLIKTEYCFTVSVLTTKFYQKIKSGKMGASSSCLPVNEGSHELVYRFGDCMIAAWYRVSQMAFLYRDRHVLPPSRTTAATGKI